MFLMPRNGLKDETILSSALDAMRSVLPSAWDLAFDAATRNDESLDGLVTLEGPNSVRVEFAVQAKRSGASSATTLADQLTAIAARTSPRPLLFLTDYASPAVRSELSQAGVSYADATGWVRIMNDEPLLLLSAEGAARSPRPRSTTDITRLGGRGASRIIRALLDGAAPLGVRQLAELSGTSPGSVAKVLPTLTADGAIERDMTGNVALIRKRALLDRWTQDYAFLNSNSVVLDYLAPRGLEPILSELRDRAGVCVTGSAAARTYLPERTVPLVPLTQLACFARDIQRLANDLGMVRQERFAANVLLTQPTDPLLLDRPRRSPDGLPIAPASQVLADLVTLPGRSAQEADQLIEVLAKTDPAWKL
jgi:DNA-binding HxlR family transcriptional regulator